MNKEHRDDAGQDAWQAFIVEHLAASGLSGTEFADLVGVSGSAVSRWRSGDRMPGDTATVVKIARILGTSLHEALTAAGYMVEKTVGDAPMVVMKPLAEVGDEELLQEVSRRGLSHAPTSQDARPSTSQRRISGSSRTVPSAWRPYFEAAGIEFSFRALVRELGDEVQLNTVIRTLTGVGRSSTRVVAPIANALGVTVEEVYELRETLDVDDSFSGEPFILPREAASLSGPEREAVLAVVRSILEAHSASEELLSLSQARQLADTGERHSLDDVVRQLGIDEN